MWSICNTDVWRTSNNCVRTCFHQKITTKVYGTMRVLVFFYSNTLFTYRRCSSLFDVVDSCNRVGRPTIAFELASIKKYQQRFMGQCKYRFFFTVIPSLFTDVARHYSMSLTHAAESCRHSCGFSLTHTSDTRMTIWFHVSASV